MKRFRWPLQRLLQVTEQRELGLRSQVLGLLRRTTALRRDVLQRGIALRSTLEDLSNIDLQDRIRLQKVLLEGSARSEEEIAQLRGKIQELTKERAERAAELTSVRRSRETLGRLREEALQKHRRDELKREQKEFDQNAQIAFVRVASQERTRELESRE